jgi:hypothetical protein
MEHMRVWDRIYRIPNGPPCPSPALASNGSTLSGLTLCGLMDSSCWAVSGVVSDWRSRAGPMDDFSGWVITTPKMARWAATCPSIICG